MLAGTVAKTLSVASMWPASAVTAISVTPLVSRSAWQAASSQTVPREDGDIAGIVPESLLRPRRSHLPVRLRQVAGAQQGHRLHHRPRDVAHFLLHVRVL